MNARPKDRARARQPAGQRDAPRPNGDESRTGTLVVGVDIGNSTTEACVASIEPLEIAYLGSSLARTTGVKGTQANVAGVVRAIAGALSGAGVALEEISKVLVNEATPVISGLAMETITETIITESTMIGHNPETPGGIGLGVGITVPFDRLSANHSDEDVICVIPGDVDFADAALGINNAVRHGVGVQGAVVQRDDARLIANRLQRTIPIVDEVTLIDKVPLGMPAAVEVAAPGHTIRTLSNTYGLATVFGLDHEETRMVAPVSRALIGNRSAVVVRTPQGDIAARRIPAGSITLIGAKSRLTIEMDAGAHAIMSALRRVQPLEDATGEPGTNVGGMLATVRETTADLTDQSPGDIRIRDVLAVDTFEPQEVRGGLAGEFRLENAVALAAMVHTSRHPMEQVARETTNTTGIEVLIEGVEANMAVLGALTTPGTAEPLAILDLGGGSTDAALALPGEPVRTVHVAGAGDLVTKLIATELGIEDLEMAESIKRHPLAKVESLFQVRLEDGTSYFYDEPLPAEVFARVVVLDEDRGMAPIRTRHGLERIRQVRRDAKHRVFVVNALRALEQVAPMGSIRTIDFVVLLGGSALDFEIPEMVSAALAEHGIVCGTGNVRGSEGPRNAVATGLISYFASHGG
jgi:diol dehydratase reactivase alpha subunit